MGRSVILDKALSSEGDRHRWPAIAVLTGWPVVGVAALVMLGWFMRVPWMVQIIPGTTAMVFSNALCLFLLAIALILTTLQRRWCKPVQTRDRDRRAAGRRDRHGAVLFRCDAATRPGRPARLAQRQSRTDGAHHRARACAGGPHRTIGDAHPRRHACALPALIGTFTVALLGIIGLVSYRLHPELLYGWHVETRMALHTGTAFVLLGIGYAAAAYRTQQLGELFRQREDLRVGLLGGGLMVFVGLVGGLVAFSLMQEQLLTVLQDGLKLSFQSRHDLIVSEIQSSIQATRDFAQRPGIERELGRLQSDPENRAARQYIETALHRHVATGPTGMRLFDDRGRLVASAGSILGGNLELPLQQPGDVALLWNGEVVGLRVAQDIRVQRPVVGQGRIDLPAAGHFTHARRRARFRRQRRHGAVCAHGTGHPLSADDAESATHRDAGRHARRLPADGARARGRTWSRVGDRLSRRAGDRRLRAGGGSGSRSGAEGGRRRDLRADSPPIRAHAAGDRADRRRGHPAVARAPGAAGAAAGALGETLPRPARVRARRHAGHRSRWAHRLGQFADRAAVRIRAGGADRPAGGDPDSGRRARGPCREAGRLCASSRCTGT